MAGLAFDEALEDGWARGIHPDDRKKIREAWKRMVESDGGWGLEYRFRTPAGKTTLVYGLASPLRDSAGRVTGFVGTNTDVAELRRGEERLREANLLNQQIIASVREGLIVCGPDLRCRVWNPFTERIVTGPLRGPSDRRAAGARDRHAGGYQS